MLISKEDVLKLAKIAKLSIEDEKLDEMTREMNTLANFAEEINKINCEGLNFEAKDNLYNVFREDIVEPSYDREEILKSADGGFDGFFSSRR